MAWEFENDRPIYIQIMDRIKCMIISGQYKSQDKIEAVRALASEAAVNPNTMQKALTELEREGLLKTNRTNGRYVTDNEEIIEKLKQRLVLERWETMVKELSSLGLQQSEIEDFVRKKLEDLRA